jgi:hypothetical protein
LGHDGSCRFDGWCGEDVGTFLPINQSRWRSNVSSAGTVNHISWHLCPSTDGVPDMPDALRRPSRILQGILYYSYTKRSGRGINGAPGETGIFGWQFLLHGPLLEYNHFASLDAKRSQLQNSLNRIRNNHFPGPSEDTNVRFPEHQIILKIADRVRKFSASTRQRVQRTKAR